MTQIVGLGILPEMRVPEMRAPARLTSPALKPASPRSPARARLPQTGRAKLPDGLWGVVFAGPTGRNGVAAAMLRDDAVFAWSSAFNPAAGDKAALAWRTLARRLVDIVLAVLLLVLTAPILLVTALLVALGSPGPVLYRQERVGLDGGCFILWKFRSMRSDAERLGPVWAAPQDARVTGVGRLIRKVRIDELPQLVNILRGEMSLVGPRPERPHFVGQLMAAIPLYRERARVKPGLTGWAQVNYPYGASVEDAAAKLAYDLYYVKHRSLRFDLLILLATVRVILFQQGAR